MRPWVLFLIELKISIYLIHQCTPLVKVFLKVQSSFCPNSKFTRISGTSRNINNQIKYNSNSLLLPIVTLFFSFKLNSCVEYSKKYYDLTILLKKGPEWIKPRACIYSSATKNDLRRQATNMKLKYSRYYPKSHVIIQLPKLNQEKEEKIPICVINTNFRSVCFVIH